LLHEDGIDLNGIVLQSSILDTSQSNNSVGILPTFAADAYYHNKVTVSPLPNDLSSFIQQVEEFACGPFATAKAAYPNVDPATLQRLSQFIGISPDILKKWKLDLGVTNDIGNLIYLTSLLGDDGEELGIYDGRVKANETGIAGSVSLNSGGNDPTLTAVGGVYTAMWNVYLNEELKYTATSPFMDLNDQAFENWDWHHVDPTGAQKGGSFGTLYTAGDLAASMEINPCLKVFCANGYYDAVTPFFQTHMDLKNMPIGDKKSLNNLEFHNYESGHMIYLDNLKNSRSNMKKDLAAFYDNTLAHHATLATAKISSNAEGRARPSRYRRRFNRTPY
jgi:carboxypeptidase C (cathepsin A)